MDLTTWDSMKVNGNFMFLLLLNSVLNYLSDGVLPIRSNDVLMNIKPWA